MTFDSVAIGAFLVTYLIHSTLLLTGVWLATRLWPLAAAEPEHRDLLWKLALAGGIVTSSVHALIVPPHWGAEIALTFQLPKPSDTFDLSRAKGTVLRPSSQRNPASQLESDAVQTTAIDPRFASGEMATSRINAVGNFPLKANDMWSVVTWSWIVGCGLVLMRLALNWHGLRQFHRRCRRIMDPQLISLVSQIARRVRVYRPVELYLSSGPEGPMAAGLLRYRLYVPKSFLRQLDRQQLRALLAHELAHLAQRDPWWNLASEVICSVLFFQPLNFYARCQIRIQAEYIADRRTVAILSDGLGLARCLAALAEWSFAVAEPRGRVSPLAAGMGTFRSMLGRRISRLLGQQTLNKNPSKVVAGTCIAAMLLMSIVICAVGPRASAQPRFRTAQPEGETSMLRSNNTKAAIGSLAIAVGLAIPSAVAAEQETNEPVAVALVDEQQTTTSQLPDGVHGFNGQVRGVVVATGNNRVTFRVARITQVWKKANRAENPEALLGKTVEVTPSDAGFENSLQVKFVAALRPDQELTLNLRHVQGATFVITELDQDQRQLASGSERDVARSSGSLDSRKVPAGLYGFSGRVVGRLVNKDTEKGELVLQITHVDRVWRGNKAKEPRSAVGRTLKIEGVFGKFLDTLLTLEEGDGVRIETKHVSGDNLVFLGEGLEKVALEDQPRDTRREDQPQQSSSESPAGLAGFRGMLVGKVVSTDVEAGQLVFKMESVKHVWKQNQAKNPERAAGQDLTVTGISGKFLDVLLVLKPGDTVEVEAFHIRGPHLQFPGEWLKKVQ